MPRIPNGVVHLAAFFYKSSAVDAANPVPIGAGITVFRPVEEGSDEHVCYLVTNGHVVAAGGVYVRAAIGDDLRLIDPADWEFADVDDLAVITLPGTHTLPGNSGIFYPGLVSDPATFEKLDIGVGDEIFSVGSGGEVNGWGPVARFGNIVSWPPRPMTDGRRNTVDLLLGEMRSRGGDSGAPVFVHIAGGGTRGPGKTVIPPQGQIAFIGLVSGHVPWTERATMWDGGQEKLVHVKGNTNISLIVPWTRVIDLVDRHYQSGPYGAMD